MGLFSRKDWNVIAVIFQKKDVYLVNGNRAKGSKATSTLDGAKAHDRTIYWAVFDQKRSLIESEIGPARNLVPAGAIKQLIKVLHTNPTIQQVLSELESGGDKQVAKAMEWDSYPTD